MYVIDDEAALRAADTLPLPPALLAPLARRARDTLDAGLGGLTTIVVVLASDQEEVLAAAIGGSLLHNTLTGLSWGEPGFWPRVDWIEANLGCWEVVQCVGDGGFAYVVFVQERDDALGQACAASAK